MSLKKDAAVDSIDVKLMCQRLHGLGFVPPPPCAPVFSSSNNVSTKFPSLLPTSSPPLPMLHFGLWSAKCYSAGNHWKSEVSGAIVWCIDMPGKTIDMMVMMMMMMMMMMLAVLMSLNLPLP